MDWVLDVGRSVGSRWKVMASAGIAPSFFKVSSASLWMGP